MAAWGNKQKAPSLLHPECSWLKPELDFSVGVERLGNVGEVLYEAPVASTQSQRAFTSRVFLLAAAKDRKSCHPEVCQEKHYPKHCQHYVLAARDSVTEQPIDVADCTHGERGKDTCRFQKATMPLVTLRNVGMTSVVQRAVSVEDWALGGIIESAKHYTLYVEGVGPRASSGSEGGAEVLARLLDLMRPLAGQLDQGRVPPNPHSPVWQGLLAQLLQLQSKLCEHPEIPRGVKREEHQLLQSLVLTVLHRTLTPVGDADHYVTLIAKLSSENEALRSKVKAMDQAMLTGSDRQQFQRDMREMNVQLETVRHEKQELLEQLQLETAKALSLEEKTRFGKRRPSQEQEALDILKILQREGQELDTERRQLQEKEQELRRKLAEVEEEREEQTRSRNRLLQRIAQDSQKWQILEMQYQEQLGVLAQENKRLSDENKDLRSRLETEIQVAEELRKQMTSHRRQQAGEGDGEGEDWQARVVKAKAQVTSRAAQAQCHLEDTHHRLRGQDLDSFMHALPRDLKEECVRIQRHVGGFGRRFSELLLGPGLSWGDEELEEGGFFFTCRKFWLAVRKWVRAAEDSSNQTPLTAQHLHGVCRQLKLNPTTVVPMSAVHEDVLEGSFSYLVDNLEPLEVTVFLRDVRRLTEEAWTFLLLPGTRRQKVDRLLAVLYSLGEDGWRLLLQSLEPSYHQHVLEKLTQDEADLQVGHCPEQPVGTEGHRPVVGRSSMTSLQRIPEGMPMVTPVVQPLTRYTDVTTSATTRDLDKMASTLTSDIRVMLERVQTSIMEGVARLGATGTPLQQNGVKTRKKRNGCSTT